MEVSSQLHVSAALLQGKSPGTCWIGRWVGPRADLDAVSKVVPELNRTPRHEDACRSGGTASPILNLGTRWSWRRVNNLCPCRESNPGRSGRSCPYFMYVSNCKTKVIQYTKTGFKVIYTSRPTSEGQVQRCQPTHVAAMGMIRSLTYAHKSLHDADNYSGLHIIFALTRISLGRREMAASDSSVGSVGIDHLMRSMGG
jgi:hypothetical protein